MAQGISHDQSIVHFIHLTRWSANLTNILKVHYGLLMAIYRYANSKVAPPCQMKMEYTYYRFKDIKLPDCLLNMMLHWELH